MKLPKMPLPESPPGQPKSLWTTVSVATPVILTVFATVLAGLSSSEMTLAQYHRSMAAQNQSKASDQWNFFQAKRIRGTEVQRTIRLLQALSEPLKIEVNSLESLSTAALRDLHRVQGETSRLLETIGAAKSEMGPAAATLHEIATRLQQALADRIVAVERAGARLKQELTRKEIQEAIHYLTTNELPPAAAASAREPAINQALDAIRLRRPDSDLAPILREITDAEFAQAIRQADDHIAAVEQAGKPIGVRLDELDRTVQEIVAYPHSVSQAVSELNAVASEVAADANKPPAAMNARVSAIAAALAALRSSATQSREGFIVAADSYTVRRYDREAQANQEAAALYEIQVRRSDMKSERHRGRSKFFFYGMLAAQAGVTIASFSLALRHRSLLWTLAAAAGLGAVLFGVYVYLYM